jgi:hypothetical protein
VSYQQSERRRNVRFEAVDGCSNDARKAIEVSAVTAVMIRSSEMQTIKTIGLDIAYVFGPDPMALTTASGDGCVRFSNRPFGVKHLF